MSCKANPREGDRPHRGGLGHRAAGALSAWARSGKSGCLAPGLGAGLLGAIFLALRYAVRPVTKAPVPDTISPAIFRTKALHTSLGQIVYHESGSGPTLVFIHGICPGRLVLRMVEGLPRNSPEPIACSRRI